jgi:uncharacterized protein
MQNQFDPRSTTGAGGGVNPAATVGVPRAARDAGLRSYMLSVYNYMASGVLLDRHRRPAVLQQRACRPGDGTPLQWVIMLSPLAFVMVMSFGMNRLSTPTLQMMFWAFATAMGLSMSSIFLVFTGISIAQTFFAVAAGFAASACGATRPRRTCPAGAPS